MLANSKLPQGLKPFRSLNEHVATIVAINKLIAITIVSVIRAVESWFCLSLHAGSQHRDNINDKR